MRFNVIFKTGTNVSVLGIILTLLTLCPQFVLGQGFSLDYELEQGLSNYQNAQFKEAFTHFEKVSEVLSQSGDQEALPEIYYLCHSCKYASGDKAGSIPFGEKVLNFTTFPLEYQIQVLSSLLSAYDELGHEDKCLSTVAKLNLLWKSYKVTDIIHSLFLYYSKHGEYGKITSFESDLQYLKSWDASNDIDRILTTTQLNTIYILMAVAFSEQREYNKSLSYLERALETLSPDDQEIKSAVYLKMADNYKILGDKKSALKYQKLAIESEQ